MTESTEQPIEPAGVRGERSPAARLAILSFASGLVLCCPGTGLVAVLAGGLALVLGMRAQDVSWRKYAYGGMALGTTSLVAVSLLWGVATDRWETEWRVLLTGPNNALFAMQEGAFDDFRAEFIGAGSEATDEEIEVLAELVKTKLGIFGRARSTRTEPPEFDGPPPWELGDYEVLFSNPEKGGWTGSVSGTIGLDRLPSGTLRLDWFRLEGEGPDGEQVLVRFPPTTRSDRKSE